MVQSDPPTLRFVTPMECREVCDESQIPFGPEWQYEIKFGGYRCIALKQNNETELLSRRGLPFRPFSNLHQEIRAQPPKSFILDGQIVALDDAGRMESRTLRDMRLAKLDVHFYAFDLLNLDGEDLKEEPLARRQELLWQSFATTGFFHISPPINGELRRILHTIRQFGFEGIVAKKRNSIYVPGSRSGAWVERRVKQTDEFVVGSYITKGESLEELIWGNTAGTN